MISTSWQGELAHLRQNIDEIDRSSHTSLRFQDDLLDFILQNREKGGGLIEVGCYHGGLTAQLSFIAKKVGLAFDVIDIDPHYLKVAADTVCRVGLEGVPTFHEMDLSSYVRASAFSSGPLMVFVDGDHRYEGVVEDIRAIRSISPAPFSCAFHDFSLRYADGPLTIVRVDRAILDEFGDSVSLIPIGEVAGDGLLRTSPQEDRHYHESGAPEGVIIKL